MNELPENIMDFYELRGYIWGWLSKYINNKDFDGNEQAVKSIDFYLDWFVDRVNELEDIEMDNVNKPEHYTYSKYECIDVIKEITKDLTGEEAFCIGNAIKYLWRWKHKNGIEDVKKARWYLDRLIGSSLVYRPKDKNMLVDITTAEFTTPDDHETFVKSNGVYNAVKDYLADATNPNACVSSKPYGTGARAIYQLDNDMNVVAKFSSIAKAMRKMKNRGIDKALKRGTKSAGYYWKYAD